MEHGHSVVLDVSYSYTLCAFLLQLFVSIIIPISVSASNE